MWHNALASFSRNFAFSGQNAKKQKLKILKWSIWEAQSKGISSSSLVDKVSAHTAASKSTRLVWQCIKVFFWNFDSASLGGYVNFSFWQNFRNQKNLKMTICFRIIFSVNSKTFKDLRAIFNSVASKENKLAQF
jgi:hypothetical protein